MPHRLLLLTLVLVASPIAGCGGGVDAGAAAPSSAGRVRTASPPGPPIAEPGTLAVRRGRVDDVDLVLELSQLRRRGKLVQLEFRLRGPARGVQLSERTFDDGLAQRLTDPDSDSGYEYANTLDGIGLVDGVNGRRYAPARNRFGACVCDTGIDGTTITADHPLVLSATFGAPPGDVRAVDVVIPHFGTIPDVPFG